MQERPPSGTRGRKYFSTFSRLSANFFTSRRYILSNIARQGPQVISQQVASESRIAVTCGSRYNPAH